jgi:hypothetical protein
MGETSRQAERGVRQQQQQHNARDSNAESFQRNNHEQILTAREAHS